MKENVTFQLAALININKLHIKIIRKNIICKLYCYNSFSMSILKALALVILKHNAST